MLRPAAPARALRGAVVAVVGLGTAAAGHAYAGGSSAPTPLVVLVALALTAASVLVSRSRWTVARLLAALVGMQLAMHAALWFETGSRAVDARLEGLASSGAAHLHTSGGPTSSALMLAAHLAAAVVGAVLLSAADGALWLLHALARRIRRVGAVVPVAALAQLAVAVRGEVVPGVLELGAVGRRGPPAAPAPA